MTNSSIDHWVFDLDNTLYPSSACLFDQIEEKMEAYIVRELSISLEDAKQLRSQYWKEHGTTLNGLMNVHDVDPDPFLEEVHDIDLNDLEVCNDLNSALRALDGHRIIYTNGSRKHGRNVSTARGIFDCFHQIYGIEDAAYVPKPNLEAFERVFSAAGVDPRRAVMVEDDPRNLLAPAKLGMITVLVDSDETGDHIHYKTSDLAGFLTQVAESGFP